MDVKKRRHSPYGLATAAIAALSLVACSGNSSSGSGSSGSGTKVSQVNIAAPLELTGPVAGFAVPFSKALQQAVDYVNAHGGVTGLGGAKLHLLLQDSQSNPTTASQLLRKMDTENPKPVIALGPFSSGNSIAVKPVLQSLNMPFMTPATDDKITADNASHTMWRAVAPFSQWAKDTVDFVDAAQKAGKIHLSKVALLGMSSAPGPGLQSELAAGLTKLGVKTQTFSYPLTQTSFSGTVASLKDYDPDLIMGVTYPADSVLFAQSMALQSWRPKYGFVFTAGGYYLNSVGQQLTSKIDGWINASYGTTSGSDADACPAAVALRKAYLASGGLPLTALDTAAASEVAIIVAALNISKSTDPDAFKAALGKVNLKYCQSDTEPYLMSGGVKFDSNGNNTAFTPTFTQHQGDLTQIAVTPTTAQWPAG